MNCNYFGSHSIWERAEVWYSIYTHVSARTLHSVQSTLFNSWFFGCQLCHLHNVVPQELKKMVFVRSSKKSVPVTHEIESEWHQNGKVLEWSWDCELLQDLWCCLGKLVALWKLILKEESPAGPFLLLSVNTTEKFGFVSFLSGLKCCFSQWALRNSPCLKFGLGLCPAVKPQFLI